MSKTKDFVVVWKDAPDPEWADEMIYDLKDLADPEGGLVNLLVNGFRIKRGRLPVVSCRAWVRSSWRVLSFTVESIHARNPKPVRDLQRRIRRIGGAGWGRVRDISKFIESETGES